MPADQGGGAAFCLALPATAEGVRAALRQALTSPPLRRQSPAFRGAAELVLAEAMNNIVEHAYAGQPGRIELRMQPHAGGLAFLVTDWGRPMPGGALPPGNPPVLSAEADLPEGGFGWHLIRRLASGLDYRRIADRNVLRFDLLA
ncbi:MAG: ATP-binding protein [Rhodobacteraceae bacterium]|nr:ATP-binding protein [Paracoccaceae bacterium]